ncbi:MAG: helix-turn-helix transcriptional regulator [Rhodoferax sp.]
MQKQQTTDRLLRLTDVLALYPVSKSAWYRGMALGQYPRPVKLGKRAVAWKQSSVEAVVNAASATAE